MKKKIENLLLGLEKVARNTGEDEYDLIFFLANEDGIHITNIITPSFFSNQIAVGVLKPYTEEEYKRLKLYFISRFHSYLLDELLNKFEKGGVSYIRYLEFIDNWQVYSDIFEVLNEEHGIKSNQFNEIEWLEIFDTKEWKSCFIQTARELVANNIKYKKI
ncbi:unnamed protein product [marine sediment metagenome]|uniref:Uncharacterized protein n=1 Tax=marine sediment metagenome TaxID=412755 RepID=X1SC71_9ZZZZ